MSLLVTYLLWYQVGIRMNRLGFWAVFLCSYEGYEGALLAFSYMTLKPSNEHPVDPTDPTGTEKQDRHNSTPNSREPCAKPCAILLEP